MGGGCGHGGDLRNSRIGIIRRAEGIGEYSLLSVGVRTTSACVRIRPNLRSGVSRMKEYLELVRLVLDKGIRKPSRTGVDTLSYFGAFYRVDLAAGFPLLTTKKVNFNACLHELLWYLSGDDHIRNLRKVTKIWDAWADEKGDLETAYGRYWRRFPHPVQKSHAPIAETGETS